MLIKSMGSPDAWIYWKFSDSLLRNENKKHSIHFHFPHSFKLVDLIA